MALSLCASQAVRPVNTITPTTEMMNCRELACQNMPTTMASRRPIRPIPTKWPSPARLLFVVEPYRARAPNIPAVMTNVEAMDVPAYARKMNESVAPFKAEYATKSADAVEG